MKTETKLSENTTLTELPLLDGGRFFIITTEVEKDWAGKKNSVTTQRGIHGEATVSAVLECKQSAIAFHEYTMANLGKNDYDHLH